MKVYRNEVWDMFGNYFTEHTIKVVPRYENTVVDSLAVATGKFKTPSVGQREYQVDIINNSKYWKVFEDDMQIKIFLELSGEFVNTQIDGENGNFENYQDHEESGEEIVENGTLKTHWGGRILFS